MSATEAETLSFQAETGRLLDIVARSLYSEKEVFLRELVSNASDACDRLRYAALTEPALAAEDSRYRVELTPDSTARTLTIADNGIGMNRDELVANLGTIARSGTRAFLEQVAEGKPADLSLIGQFGVGFYSAFMVAREVEVFSRRAGEAQGWRWASDGKGQFTVAPAAAVARGTRIVLHLAEGEDEFLDPHRLRHIITTHSDHIPIPVLLRQPDGKEEVLNRGAALWTRPKSEITAEQYRDFYRHVSHAFDEPWATIHWRAEGMIDYTALLFVPGAPPFDLFEPERRHRVKLYVRRVFVCDDAEGLVPSWLRFLRGIIDSEDLPLNVSREMLQASPMVTKIRQGLTKKVLAELARRAKDDPEAYAGFWTHFGAVLKEGLYEDREHRDALLPLLRFRTTAGDGLASLEDVAGRLRPGQDAIYYATGDSPEALAASPHLEGFRARGVEVLLLTDPIDEFAIPALGSFKDLPLRSVTRASADLSRIAGPEDAPAAEPPPAEVATLVDRFRAALAGEVKDVRASQRLTDSAVCLSADDSGVDMRLERLLMRHRQIDACSKRILEVNPTHPLIRALAAADRSEEELAEIARLLLDQARIVEGEPVPDAGAFARRLAAIVTRGLAA